MNKITLKLGNKDLGFHFGLGFMGALLESLDCSIDELMRGIQKNPFKYIPKLMHEAHSYDCVRNGKENEFTVYALTDLIDEEGGVMSDSVSKFLEAFTGSITKDVPKEPIKTPRKGAKSKANLVKK